jgi:hypothetical protein
MKAIIVKVDLIFLFYKCTYVKKKYVMLQLLQSQ